MSSAGLGWSGGLPWGAPGGPVVTLRKMERWAGRQGGHLTNENAKAILPDFLHQIAQCVRSLLWGGWG